MECLLALSLWPTHCLVKHRVVKLQRSQSVNLSLLVLTFRAGKATHTALQTLWTTLLCYLWRLSSVGNKKSGLVFWQILQFVWDINLAYRGSICLAERHTVSTNALIGLFAITEVIVLQPRPNVTVHVFPHLSNKSQDGLHNSEKLSLQTACCGADTWVILHTCNLSLLDDHRL